MEPVKPREGGRAHRPLPASPIASPFGHELTWLLGRARSPSGAVWISVARGVVPRFKNIADFTYVHPRDARAAIRCRNASQ
jgi:hypothetical protein